MNGLQMKYFVLNPTKRDTYGKASRHAMMRYAEVIERENPQLAADLRAWNGSIMDGIADEIFRPYEPISPTEGE